MPDPAEKPALLHERLALRPKEAAAALGLSERTFRDLLPRLPHVRLEGAVLIPTKLLERWLEDRATAQTHEADTLAEGILADLTSENLK